LVRSAIVRLGSFTILLLGALACSGCTRTRSTADLLNDLNSAHEGERHGAVRLLAQRKADAAQVVPALIGALNDKDAEIRRSAALGLGGFGDAARDAIPALEAAGGDRDSRVREAARIALSRLDPSRFPVHAKQSVP
jgi:HEAT repeat protein